MNDILRSLDGRFWLAEPLALREAILRVARIPTCPQARELARERRERLEHFRQLAAEAIDSSGIDQPESEAAETRPLRAPRGKVGVIPIFGPVEQRWSAALSKLGGTAVEEVSVALDAMLRDGSIEAIVLHVDSPGGSAYGVEELSDKIFAARQQKKLYTSFDSLGASAAYWIGSAAETVTATPGADVGSVGVFAVHVDETAAIEGEGLKITMVKAAKYKAEFAPWQALTAEAQEHLQASVNLTYDKFVLALKRNRGVPLSQVKERFGEGRVVDAADAKSRGMIDRVISFENLMARLLGDQPGSKGKGSRASVEVLRLRHAQRKRQCAG